MSALASGDVVADRYTVGRRLGAGGGGEVWSARDERLGRGVAVKVVEEGDAGERLQREARAAAGVNHPNVVQVYDAGVEDGLVYLVMEHVEGVDLAQLLALGGALEPEAAALVGHDLALGLARVHAAGLVHRDVKPGNVLVTPDGRAKLADLGIARQVAGDATQRLTVAGTVLGTIDYLSPEQASDEYVGPPTDVYAVGLVVHHCCSGRLPFGDGTPAERLARRLTRGPVPLPHAPETLEAAVAAATARDPRERPDARALQGLLFDALPTGTEHLRSGLGRLVRVALDRRDAAASAAPAASPLPRDATRVLRTDPPTGTAPAGAPPEPRATTGAPSGSTGAPSGSTGAPSGSTGAPSGSTGAPSGDAPAPDPAVTSLWSPGVPTTPPPPPRSTGADGRDTARAAARRDVAPPPPGGDDDVFAPVLDGAGGGGRSPVGTLGRAVLGLAVVAALITFAAQRGLGPGGGGGAVEPIAIEDVATYDPQGDGSENDGALPLLLDGDTSTTWQTDRYASYPWGRLKDGVGLVVDLGERRSVGGVNLRLVSQGATAVVLVGDEPPDGVPPSGTELGTGEDLSGFARITGGPVEGRYVTVWFTEPGTSGGAARAVVSELRVTT